jgi:hypothetical protein
MNPISSPFFQLYLVRQAVYLPPTVCVWYLIRLWREGELYGVQEFAFSLWFVVSLITELVSQSTGIWIAGMLAQVALALVLILNTSHEHHPVTTCAYGGELQRTLVSTAV